MAQPPMRRERIAFELRGDVADPTFFKTQKKGDPAAQLHCRSQELSDEPSQALVGAVLGPQHMAPRPSSSNIPPRRCCWPNFFLKRKKKGNSAAQLHCRSQELSDEPSGTRVACVDVGITDKSVLRRMGSNVVIHLLQHVIIGTCIQQVFSMIFTLPLKITLSP